MSDLYDGAPLTFKCFDVAPIMVVGKIISVEDTGRAKRSRTPPHTQMKPLRMMVSVENALRGDVKGPTIEVFAFRPIVPLVGNSPFEPRPDERRLFLLRRDAGRLRLLLDNFWGSYAWHIYSGDHTRTTLPNELGKAVAVILLTPGDNVHPDVFGNRLMADAEISLHVSQDPQFVISLLNAFMRHENERYREIAAVCIRAIQSGSWSNLGEESGPCPAKL